MSTSETPSSLGSQASERPSSEPKHKYITLDAMRGLAALAVVQLHLPELFGRKYFARGGLAVDFFLLLSGFVIAFAYQRRLDNGWRTPTFLSVRVIRLYPLYLTGILLGLFVSTVSWFYPAALMTQPRAWIYFLMGLAVIPVFPFLPLPATSAFPLDFPAWSLFWEFLANILHASFFRRRSTSFFLVIVVLSSLLLIVLTAFFGTTGTGVGRRGIFLVFPRILLSYCVGILLYRHAKQRAANRRIPSFLPCLLLVGCLAIPQISKHSAAVDWFIIMPVFPLLLLLAAASEPGPRLTKLYRTLGAVSYAVYVLHIPLSHIFYALWRHATGRDPALDAPWSGVIFTVAVILISLSVERFYDRPVRARLSALLGAEARA